MRKFQRHGDHFHKLDSLLIIAALAMAPSTTVRCKFVLCVFGQQLAHGHEVRLGLMNRNDNILLKRNEFGQVCNRNDTLSSIE